MRSLRWNPCPAESGPSPRLPSPSPSRPRWLHEPRTPYNLRIKCPVIGSSWFNLISLPLYFQWVVGCMGTGNFPGRIELSMPGVLLGGGPRGAIAIASGRQGPASLRSVPQSLTAHRSVPFEPFVLKADFKVILGNTCYPLVNQHSFWKWRFSIVLWVYQRVPTYLLISEWLAIFWCGQGLPHSRHAENRRKKTTQRRRGTGIGPKAAFSYDELDVGDIFVESVHQYEAWASWQAGSLARCISVFPKISQEVQGQVGRRIWGLHLRFPKKSWGYPPKHPKFQFSSIFIWDFPWNKPFNPQFSSIFIWDFPWNKPSSYWVLPVLPIFGPPPCGRARQVNLINQGDIEPCQVWAGGGVVGNCSRLGIQWWFNGDLMVIIDRDLLVI